MNLYFVKTPKFVQRIFSKRIWAFPNNKNIVYLTFDDGPIPEVTPWVLDLLKDYKAEATFFCIGDNVKKHPHVFKRIISGGHSIGNHTFNHLNGWRTKTEDYIENCVLFEKISNCYTEPLEVPRQYNNSNLKPHHGKLFRPPYGKLSPRQFKTLQKKGYKIIMWDVLSADFDQNISKEKCLENVLNSITSGSIVVFHDSLKSEEKLRYVLPKVLKYLKNEKYSIERIKY
mgnify:CR=1 FL=1